MSELLQSLRDDLFSRRMLPLLALVALALVGAVGFAVAGSGSTAPPRAGGGSAAAAPQATLAVAAAAPNPNAAEAETPGGARYQTQGPLRNPFAPLPEAKSSAAASHGAAQPNSAGKAGGPSGGAGAATSGGSGGKGGSPGGGSIPAKGKPSPPTPAKPSKPKPSYPYDVSILFGQLPASGQPVTLPPYQDLQPQKPLPSATDARIALTRVGRNTRSAVFALLTPPILRGQGICLPSASECQQLALEVGRYEELEYVEASGQTVVYELKTVSIVKRSSQNAG